MSIIVIKGKKHNLEPGVVAGYVVTPLAGIIFVSALLKGESLGPTLFSFFFLLIGLYLALTREDFLLDIDQRKFRQCTFFLGIRFGEWERLPQVEAVSVMQYKESYMIKDGINPQMNFSSYKFKVMLVVKDSERGIIISIFKRERALEVARLLADKLKVEMWDQA